MSDQQLISLKRKQAQNRCLSCGTSENINNRKYCSIRCRQNLRQRLNARNGLLQALNTRWAAFYFSDKMIYLDICAGGYKEIYQFSYKRVAGQKPSDDFGKLTNELARAWWAEEKRSKKKYLASKHVLSLAVKSTVAASLRPKVLKANSVQEGSLLCLGMKKTELESIDLKKIIKNAYRRQAKIHHPDLGGFAATFRKINKAYRELLQWAENPRFVKRKGFTDKWFYDGENDKWVQPIPIKK
jgi:hypothetical protein